MSDRITEICKQVISKATSIIGITTAIESASIYNHDLLSEFVKIRNDDLSHLRGLVASLNEGTEV